jgi:hypothetical protein
MSTLTYPKKLAFRVTNSSTAAVFLTSCDFEMGSRLKGHPDRSTGRVNAFKVEFFAYRNSSGKDVHQTDALLKPGMSVRAWLALDSATDNAVARDALATTEIGMWRFTGHWLGEPMELREYELRF